MELRLLAVGDVLTHLDIVRAAAGRGYAMLFQHMAPVFREADILLGNQETGLTDRVEPSGFPVFATPTAVGTAEEEAGFDLLTLATNHTLDRGKKGMADAVDFWSKRETALAIGIRRRSDGAEACVAGGKPYTVIERNGIRVAFLNYTDPTNLHMNPLSGDYRVSLLRKSRRKTIAEEIRAARAEADFAVVCAHWGIEYLYEPVKSQKKWADLFVDAGADLVIGTHPHVVEPLGKVTAADGREVPVFWSLGNFISCQCFPGTLLGGLAEVTFRLGEGERAVTCELKPLIAHADEDGFTVYPLAGYTEEQCLSNRIAQNIAREFGEPVTAAGTRELFEKIQNGTALREARFKKPSDVRRYNAGRIVKLLKKHAPH